MHALGFSPRTQARRLDARAAPRGRAKQGQHRISVEMLLHSCGCGGSSRPRLQLGRHTLAAAGPSDPGVGDSQGDDLGQEGASTESGEGATPENGAERDEDAPEKEVVEGGESDGDDDSTAETRAPDEVEVEAVDDSEEKGKGKDEPEELDADSIIQEHKAEDDENISDILDRIGFKSKASQGSEVEASQVSTNYPEPPEISMTFGDLLKKCDYTDEVLAEVLDQYSAVLDVTVKGIQNDSHDVHEGDIYVCEVGPYHNGHHFIPEAVTRGASLIIAKLMLPGAELAMVADIDPEDEGYKEIFEHKYYQLLENDDIICTEAVKEVKKSDKQLDKWAKEQGIDDETRDKAKTASALRIISSALGYDTSHWMDPNGSNPKDHQMTPHPLNIQVPVELDTPCIFAIDTIDFAATLAQAFYNDPSQRLLTFSVTGSRGKTTVAWLLRSVLEHAGKLTGMICSIEWAIATDRLDLRGDLWEPDEEDPTLKRECSAPYKVVPWQGKYELPCTTPDHISMQQVLAGMADRGAEACVIEASGIGIMQGRVDNVDMDVAIFTNIRNDHLDFHETVEETVNQKERLFEGLTDPDRQVAVVNLDDEFTANIMKVASAVPIVTYSMSNTEADVYTLSTEFSIWESTALIQTPQGALKLTTPLIGRSNMYNILACISAALAKRIPLQTIANALQHAELVPGRYEIIDEGQKFQVFVDAANTPESLNALLDSVRECVDVKRIILVFGCPGDEGKSQRAYMGEVAHYKADIVIITNDNPRTEPPEAIVQSIVDGFPDEVKNAYPGSYYNFLVDVGRVQPFFEEELLERQGEHSRHVIEDRFSAIRAAISIGQPNDVVIIAGKGHGDFIDYADVHGTKYRGWFDDRVEARNALSKLSYLESIPYLVRKKLPWTSSRKWK